MKRAWLIIILLLSFPAFAEETLTLDQARDIAIKNHPDVLSAGFNTQAAEEDVKATRSAYFPQITGNAVRAYAGDDTRIAAPGSLNNPLIINRGSAGVGLSQLITDFGRTGDLLASSKLQLEAQKSRTTFTRDTVLLDVTRAYYNVLRAKTLLKVAEETLKTRQTLLDQITSLRNVKIKSDLDLSIAKQTVNDANLLLLKAQTGVSDAEATLSEALGLNQPRHFILTDGSKVTMPPDQVDLLIQAALEMNPELAALKAEKGAAERFAEAQTEAQYPTVSALGFAGATPIRDSDQQIESNYAAAGVNVSIPLFTGGLLTAQERKAKYKAKASGEDLEARKNQIVRDIQVAFDNTQTSYKNINVTQELLKNTTDALNLTQARYDLGKSSIVDLSEAQLFQTQAQIQNANAAYEYLIQLALLEYKIGGNVSINPAGRIR